MNMSKNKQKAFKNVLGTVFRGTPTDNVIEALQEEVSILTHSESKGFKTIRTLRNQVRSLLRENKELRSQLAEREVTIASQDDMLLDAHALANDLGFMAGVNDQFIQTYQVLKAKR